MQVPEIDTERAQSLLADSAATFVDVRDPDSYAAAHIPGAVNLDDSNVEQFLTDTGKTDNVVVYCYKGVSSLGAAAFFMERGFTAVSSLTGGFTAWESAGGAAEASKGSGR